MKKKDYTVEEIVQHLKAEKENATIEGDLLKKRFIRELYKKLGNPEEKDFPDIYDIAGGGWKKIQGYTTDIAFLRPSTMETQNNAHTIWNIERASMTKINIEDKYSRAGWHCQVQSFNVLCTKYVKHPKYENIWVWFYSSRDCNKYQYIIENEENGEA